MTIRPSMMTLTRPGPLRLYGTPELLRMPPPTWLIDTIMPAGGLVGLYGAPGVGKSFIAIDMALSISTGTAWQGRACQGGYVVYVSAEGGTGISKRVRAWLEHRHVTAGQAEVAWLVESIPIHVDSEQMAILLNRIVEEIEEEPALVVVDTLARCFDGDENQQEDMGRFIAGVDKLRTDLQSTLLVVHHTRLDGSRERGNTAFRGAADAMLAVDRLPNGQIQLSCNKQKDSEEFQPFAMKLVQVPDTDSCIVEHPTYRLPKLDKTPDLIEVLRENGPLTWSEWFHQSGTSKKLFSEGLRNLRESGKLLNENGNYAYIE